MFEFNFVLTFTVLLRCIWMDFFLLAEECLMYLSSLRYLKYSDIYETLLTRYLPVQRGNKHLLQFVFHRYLLNKSLSKSKLPINLMPVRTSV